MVPTNSSHTGCQSDHESGGCPICNLESRNSAVWEAKVLVPASVVAMAERSVHSWQLSQPTPSPPRATHGQVPLPPTLFRCHVDAAYDCDTRKATAGVVLLNPSGEFVAAMSTLLPLFDSAIMAETLACKEALSWLKNMNEEAVMVLTHCAILCGNLSSSLEILSYIGIATNECRRLMSSIVSCLVSYIPRSDNFLAHALARDCFSSLQDDIMFWDVVPPISILELLI